MKKYNIKKSTIKKLVNTKKSTIKKLVNTVAKGKKLTATSKTFKRALYRANKMIANGNSFYKNKLSMKEFKREYQQFGKRTGMLKGKNPNKDLKIFLANQISNRTPKQCESAADNLMNHLNDAVSALNESKDGIKSLSDTNQKYIKVLIENGALKTDKGVYSIIKEKVPNKEDLLTVNDKCLKFKRTLIKYFGDQEYTEAYGS